MIIQLLIIMNTKAPVFYLVKKLRGRNHSKTVLVLFWESRRTSLWGAYMQI
jgi:hypothetical protein